MCQQLKITRAAYYKWLHREIPDYELENIKLAELIKEYDERFNHILGYRRMTSWINHFNHTNYKKKRVHRIMKKLGIIGAMTVEIAALKDAMEDMALHSCAGMEFYEGKLEGLDVVVVQCGIGKVNAATAYSECEAAA